MITRLHFKNWRSLKDAEINFTTPITVFIGANSSGKTNILDGLLFLKDDVTKGIVQTVFDWRGREKIQTRGSDADHIKIDIDIKVSATEMVSRELIIRFHQRRNTPFQYSRAIKQNGREYFEYPLTEMPRPVGSAIPIESDAKMDQFSEKIDDIIVKRWQILEENFMPLESLSTKMTGDIYVMAPDAYNTMFILDFMKETYPQIYEKLQEDLSWMLGHLHQSVTQRTSSETRLIVKEKIAPDHEAPTISAGTLRIIAMLLPFYALDMRYPELPGLVAIEEPDTALNPLLLKNFVEQLRNYTEREGHPRQIILTTHNPVFLNYFEAEEVRIVERDENGYTQVSEVPDDIKEIWLQKHTLGEAWMSRVLGGVPSL
jgi:predicted ATPase